MTPTKSEAENVASVVTYTAFYDTSRRTRQLFDLRHCQNNC